MQISNGVKSTIRSRLNSYYKNVYKHHNLLKKRVSLIKSRMLCKSAVLNNSSIEETNEMFVASIVKIRTLNKDVLDSEWTLTSCALRLVCT